jgi:hypothetical protein
VSVHWATDNCFKIKEKLHGSGIYSMCLWFSLEDRNVFYSEAHIHGCILLSRRMRLAGHVARMGEMSDAYVFIGKSEKKRLPVRLRRILFVHLFVCGLFNDAVNSSVYRASNCRMSSETMNWKGCGRSHRDLI